VCCQPLYSASHACTADIQIDIGCWPCSAILTRMVILRQQRKRSKSCKMHTACSRIPTSARGAYAGCSAMRLLPHAIFYFQRRYDTHRESFLRGDNASSSSAASEGANGTQSSSSTFASTTTSFFHNAFPLPNLADDIDLVSVRPALIHNSFPSNGTCTTPPPLAVVTAASQFTHHRCATAVLSRASALTLLDFGG
jgi:hypothetical protein